MRFGITEYVKGQRMERIARQNGRGFIKGAMHSGFAMPHIIIVHARQIIVDERVNVNAFDGTADAQGRIIADVKKPG